MVELMLGTCLLHNVGKELVYLLNPVFRLPPPPISGETSPSIYDPEDEGRLKISYIPSKINYCVNTD